MIDRYFFGAEELEGVKDWYPDYVWLEHDRRPRSCGIIVEMEDGTEISAVTLMIAKGAWVPKEERWTVFKISLENGRDIVSVLETESQK